MLIKLFFDTTDRKPVRAKVAGRRNDVATEVEVQAVRVFAVRRGRPTVAAATDIVETAISAVAITRSRIPDGGSRAELTGEIHAFIGTVVK